ncbi:hypothetical protein IIC68_01540 [archaeon]|nr:hypothetical protein [archaeon]
MAFVEFFGNLFALNFGWILGFILDNLFWLFALSAVTYIIFGEKKFWIGLVVFIPALWLWGAWESISGVALFGAKTLSLYYVSKIAVLAFAESSQFLKDKFVIVSSIQGVIAIFVAQLI